MVLTAHACVSASCGVNTELGPEHVLHQLTPHHLMKTNVMPLIELIARAVQGHGQRGRSRGFHPVPPLHPALRLLGAQKDGPIRSHAPPPPAAAPGPRRYETREQF